MNKKNFKNRLSQLKTNLRHKSESRFIFIYDVFLRKKDKKKTLRKLLIQFLCEKIGLFIFKKTAYALPLQSRFKKEPF